MTIRGMPKLILHSTTYTLPEEDEAPLWVQLLPPSGFAGRDGRGPYTYDAQALIAAYDKFGMPLPIDYEHQSITASDKTDATPGAGWIVEVEAREDGFWGRVEWTRRAREFIVQREYKYLSPVFIAPEGDVVEMLGAGLTNNPNLQLTAFSTLHRGDYTSQHNQEVTQTMNSEILKALGLAEDADEAAILAAIAALAEKAAKADEVATEIGVEANATVADLVAHAQTRFATDLSTYAPKADLEAMSAKAATAETALAALQASVHTAAIAAVIDGAVAAGKLPPAQKEAMRKLAEQDLPAVEALMAAAPVILHGSAHTHAHHPDTPVTHANASNIRTWGVDPAKVLADQAKRKQTL